MFRQGEIISVKWYLGVEHDGIYTAKGTVISASARTGEVVEEEIATFCDGKPVVSKGYPGDFPPDIVEENARKRIGRKYNLLKYNCQHFASECHGKKKSRQLRSVVIGLAATAAVIALTHIGKKRA